MKRVFKVIALFTSVAVAIWPVPKQYTYGHDVLWIEPDVKVIYNEPSGVWQETIFPWNADVLTTTSNQYTQYTLGDFKNGTATGVTPANIISEAVQRAHDTIFTQNFVPWKFYTRMSEFEPKTGDNVQKNYVTSIELQQNKFDPPNPPRTLDGELDESYSLSVISNGKATISANTSAGLAYGLNTFTQLFYAHSSGGAYTPLIPVSITDAPKFAHRGLNIDVSRNFYPVSALLRTIDALAYNKFNRLHIHITDAQSWPLDVPSMPELSAKGAYNPSQVYQPDDIAELQQFGALRGVQVYLEIDMPGHTASIAYSHPDLIAAFNVQPNWSAVAAEPPSGVFKLNDPAVGTFIEKLFADVLPRVGANTPYFHTGGDEVPYGAYELDPTVKSSDPSVIKPFLQKFIDAAHKQVRAAGLTPIVWEEMLLSYNLTLNKDVIVQSWLADDSVSQITQKGYGAIAGSYEYWYLDCGHGQFLNFEPGTVSQMSWPYTDYCDPFKNWKLMYSYDPLEGITDEAPQKLVLGGEAHVWSEQIDATSLDSTIWPRLGAAAEVLWSGAKDPVTGMSSILYLLPLNYLQSAVVLTHLQARIAHRLLQHRGCQKCANDS